MTKNGRLTELLFYFLRLGLLGFGGPVALVGQMEREVVAERGWLSKEQMREAIAICQSLPGPLAIQVGIYIAYLRGGFCGTWIGGWAFIFPKLSSSLHSAGHSRLARGEETLVKIARSFAVSHMTISRIKSRCAAQMIRSTGGLQNLGAKIAARGPGRRRARLRA
jgi:chromate transport protein ChrA